MSEKVEIPYEFKFDEQKLISEHFNQHQDWSLNIFKDLKANLIFHLRLQQNNKCTYCKRVLGFDIKDVEIEHILPKCKYTQFTFHPRNLVLACPGCNNQKSITDTLIKKDIKKYPRTGSNIRIVHGHFDSYSEHIKIHDEAVYEGLSNKGYETLKVCKIFRLKEVLKNQRQHNVSKSKIGEIVESIRTASNDDKKALIDALKELTNNFGAG